MAALRKRRTTDAAEQAPQEEAQATLDFEATENTAPETTEAPVENNESAETKEVAEETATEEKTADEGGEHSEPAKVQIKRKRVVATANNQNKSFNNIKMISKNLN